MEKKLIIAARILSITFNPFYLSLVGLIFLFWFSYLNMLPTAYKLTVLFIVYLFTILFPTLLIRLYRNYHGWKLFELGQKERRMIPYIISILSYFVCCYVLDYYHVTHIITSILVAALMIQIICATINVWWKISTHSAAIGGVTGGVIVFSFAFGFYLLWWLSLCLIISGLVGSSRLILRQHTLSQVLIGYIVGMIITATTILFI